MPYGIRKRGNKFVVINTTTDNVKGTHRSRAGAQRQLNLLRGVEHGWQPTGAKARNKRKTKRRKKR
ncbi:MAG: hypothetical protein ACYS30_24840 [Planctomycetota bacterium]